MNDSISNLEQACIDYLQGLEEASFTMWFYRMVEARRERQLATDTATNAARFVVLDGFMGTVRGKPQVCVVVPCLPTREEYEKGSAAVIDQFVESGRCQRCKSLLHSPTKRANCPICGTVGFLG